jgi:hypothetical protein
LALAYTGPMVVLLQLCLHCRAACNNPHAVNNCARCTQIHVVVLMSKMDTNETKLSLNSDFQAEFKLPDEKLYFKESLKVLMST